MTETSSITIGGVEVGPASPVFVVAELSANHANDIAVAKDLVRAASAAGADAVKLQTYTPDTMTLDSDGDVFRIHGTLWNDRRLYDLYEEAFLPWEWHRPLKELADELGVLLFSSAFDATAVDFLEALEVPAHKVASFEIVDIPLIERMAATGKPVIISTGMATLDEITEAVEAARGAGATELALLKCTSSYPAEPDEMDLATIADLADRFRVPVGLSDHTTGRDVAVAAVALGACIVEKHITLSRTAGGPDAAFSLEPDEFADLVSGVRAARAAVGGVTYGPGPGESEARSLRRSLFVVADIRAGEPLSLENVRSLRPAAGLHPRHLHEIVGARARRDIARGTPLTWDDIDRRAT